MRYLVQALLPLIVITALPVEAAEPAFESWPELVNPFESTGGGGIMIDGYRPIVANGQCRTAFTVKMPDGAVFDNEAVFDAEAKQGGQHCRNGRWRTKDGSAEGTTPFEMFIKDGVVRRIPT